MLLSLMFGSEKVCCEVLASLRLYSLRRQGVQDDLQYLEGKCVVIMNFSVSPDDDSFNLHQLTDFVN